MDKKIFFLLITLLLLTPQAQAVKFWAVNFAMWTNPFTASVGKIVSMPVYIQNLGVLTDSYTVNVTPLPVDTSQVGIGQYGNIVEVGPNEVQNIFIPITPLFSDSNGITLNLIVNSSIAVSGGCIPPPCSMMSSITIKTGLASLSEFGSFGFIVIVVAATILLLSRK